MIRCPDSQRQQLELEKVNFLGGEWVYQKQGVLENGSCCSDGVVRGSDGFAECEGLACFLTFFTTGSQPGSPSRQQVCCVWETASGASLPCSQAREYVIPLSSNISPFLHKLKCNFVKKLFSVIPVSHGSHTLTYMNDLDNCCNTTKPCEVVTQCLFYALINAGKGPKLKSHHVQVYPPKPWCRVSSSGQDVGRTWACQPRYRIAI